MDGAQQDDVRRTLAERHGDLQAAMRRLRAFLNHRCEDLQGYGFHFRWTEERVKEPNSVIRTLNERELAPDRLWTDVDDMIGARVVVVTKNMAERLRDRIMEDLESPIRDPEARDVHLPATGYRAIHIKGRYPTD